MQPKLPLLFILLLFITALHAQRVDVDSLIRELGKSQDDTNKVIIYRMLTGTIRNTDPARAIKYGLAGVALGKKLKFDKGIAGCYLNISAAYSSASKLDSALIYIDSAIVWSHVAADANRLALAYLNRADFNMQIRNLKQSLKDCDTALHYAEKADNNDRRARILQTIGSVYYIQNLYTQSHEYYDKALQLYQQMGNKQMSAIVFNNKGNIYKNTGQALLAVQQFNKAIQLADSVKDAVNLPMYYGNLSDAHLETGQYDFAKQSAARSLALAEKQQNELQQAIAHTHFSQIHLKQKNFLSAIDAATKALQIAQQQKDLEWQSTAAGVLADSYLGAGDPNNAYRYLNLNKQLNDSLHKRKYDDDIAAMLTTFKVEEKNKEILLLNKDKELQRQQLSRQRTLFAGSVVLVIISLAGIGLFISRNKLRQRIKEMQLRNQIAADLHDEVGSSLSSIHMLSEMAYNREDASQKDILHKVSSYARETMDKMGDIVWMIKPAEQEGLGLKERMQGFAYEMCNSRNIHCTFNADGIEKLKLNMQQRKGLYLVFKEAINNAVKYSGANNIHVKLQSGHHNITLVVEDDGQGFDEATTKKGNGLENMYNRARELGGHTKINSAKNKGTIITFTMPSDSL